MPRRPEPDDVAVDREMRAIVDRLAAIETVDDLVAAIRDGARRLKTLIQEEEHTRQ